jgi:hypothetical protein
VEGRKAPTNWCGPATVAKEPRGNSELGSGPSPKQGRSGGRRCPRRRKGKGNGGASSWGTGVPTGAQRRGICRSRERKGREWRWRDVGGAAPLGSSGALEAFAIVGVAAFGGIAGLGTNEIDEPHWASLSFRAVLGIRFRVASQEVLGRLGQAGGRQFGNRAHSPAGGD